MNRAKDMIKHKKKEETEGEEEQKADAKEDKDNASKFKMSFTASRIWAWREGASGSEVSEPKMIEGRSVENEGIMKIKAKSRIGDI